MKINDLIQNGWRVKCISTSTTAPSYLKPGYIRVQPKFLVEYYTAKKGSISLDIYVRKSNKKIYCISDNIKRNGVGSTWIFEANCDKTIISYNDFKQIVLRTLNRHILTNNDMILIEKRRCKMHMKEYKYAISLCNKMLNSI